MIRYTYKKVLLLLTLLAVISCTGADIQLDDSNFTAFIQQNPYVFVKFYVPWCARCKAMTSDFQKLSQISRNRKFKVVQVDASKSLETVKLVKIQQYPTLYFFAKGAIIPYNGQRSVPEIFLWIESFFSSKIEVVSETQLNQIKGQQDFVLIEGGSKEQLQALQIANFIDTIVTYKHLSEEKDELKIEMVYKDLSTSVYSGEISFDAINRWTTEKTLPVVVPLKGEQQTQLVFENSQRKGAFLLFKADDYTEEAFQSYEAICKEHQDLFKCSYVDKSHSLFQPVSVLLSLGGEERSAMAYVTYGIANAWIYPDPSNMSEQGLSSFFKDLTDGKISKVISEEHRPPPSITFEHVVILNDKNYNRTIENNKYVLMFYYDSVCGNCIGLAPEYDRLAGQLKEENSKFKVAAVNLDLAQNVRKYGKVSHLPTVRVFYNGEWINYNGDKQQQKMHQFLDNCLKAKLPMRLGIVDDKDKDPYVLVHNIKDDSPIHLLKVGYTELPIYQTLNNMGTFDVSIHGLDIESYLQSGNPLTYEAPPLSDVMRWLQEQTEPTIVQLAVRNTSDKLSRALEEQTPILVVVDRDGKVSTLLELMATYCKGKKAFICGVVRKEDQDYETYNSWLEDTDETVSRLVYMTTEDFGKTIYGQPLESINEQSLDSFVESCSSKSIQQKMPSIEGTGQVPFTEQQDFPFEEQGNQAQEIPEEELLLPETEL